MHDVALPVTHDSNIIVALFVLGTIHCFGTCPWCHSLLNLLESKVPTYFLMLCAVMTDQNCLHTHQRNLQPECCLMCTQA